MSVRDGLIEFKTGVLALVHEVREGFGTKVSPVPQLEDHHRTSG